MSKEKGMTKEDFIELTGEDPEDMLGGDWENELEDMQIIAQGECQMEDSNV